LSKKSLATSLSSLCDWYPETQTSRQTKGSEDSDFGKTWRPLDNRFPYMLCFATGLASVMPRTSTVEVDFSTINYEKDHRSTLTSFSLEGILHSR
jgi:hypothetical protein